MGKVLRPLLIVAAVAVAFVPGVGTAIGGAVLGSMGGFGAIAVAVGTQVLSASIIALGAVSALQMASYRPGGAGAGSVGAFDPKSVNTDLRTPRKFLFGQGLFFADIRYAEAYGTNQEMVDYIMVLAAHRSHAVDELWLGDTRAWTSSGGVTADFAGYLTVEIILNAGAAAYHTAGTSGKWGASQRLTGCTTAKLTVKRSGNSRDSQSPFPGGLSGAVVWIGRGMPLYDPARDSTVPGGSGPQRANDCSTWAYEVSGVERGRNPALQQLAFRLGWRINGRRSVGQGMDPARLNLSEFAAAAAICDEAVTSAIEGSVRRFQAGYSGTDADSPDGVVQLLNLAMNGQVTDAGGKIGLRIAINNLATPVMTLTTDDLIGSEQWAPAAPLDQRYTVVRGEYTMPEGQTRYGAAAVPEVTISRPSLVPRPLTYDLRTVQSQQQAQRIFKQVAQRSLVQGRFEGVFGVRALLLKRHDVIEFDFTPLGWDGRLFTVEDVGRQLDGSVVLSLRRADASVFAWDASDTAPVVPVAPVKFDRALAQSWRTAGIAAGATVNEDGGGNLLKSAVTLADFSASAGNIIRQAPPYAGSAAAFVVVHQAGATGAGYLDSPGGFPVTPVERIWVRSRYYQIDLPTSSTLRIKAEFADGAGAYLAGADLFIGLRTVGTNFPNAAITEVLDSFIVPAGAAICRLSTNPNNSFGGAGFSALERPWAGRQQPAADVTAAQPVVSRLDATTGQAINRRITPQIIGSGVIQLLDVNPISATTDGGGVATISIAAHVVSDDGGTISYSSASIGGLAASTGYYVYEINPTYQGGARSYIATTDRSLLVTAGARYVGYVFTPAAGGSSTASNWSGGPNDLIP